MAETDVSNVTFLDVAVNALNKFYRSGNPASIKMVFPTAADSATDSTEEPVVFTVPKSVTRNLTSILLDSTEGAYFIQDMISDGTSVNEMLKQVSSVDAEGGDYQSKDMIQIIWEGANKPSDLDFYDSVNAVSEMCNQIAPETSSPEGSPDPDGTTLDNSLEFNAAEPNRITSPSLGALVFPSHSLSIATRNTDAVSIFMNAIPTIEMSRCVPYLSIKFVSAMPPAIKEQMSATTKELSILKFLRAGSDDNIKMGSPSTLPSKLAEGGDLLSISTPTTTDEELLAVGTAGMEIFTSPQTLINPDINAGVLDPMTPFMTLESLKVDVKGLGQALFANKVGSLSFILHDRSKMNLIAPLIAADMFAATYLIVDYGWSHPAGVDPEENPFAALINSMRDRATFNIVSTNFTIGNDGQVRLNMRLASRGVQEATSFPVTLGRYVPVAPIRALVESLIAREVAMIEGVPSDEQLKEIRVKFNISMDGVGSASVIPRGIFSSLMNAVKNTGEDRKKIVVDELTALLEGQIANAQDPTMVTELADKLERVIRKHSSDNPSPDPFYPLALHQKMTDSWGNPLPTGAEELGEHGNGTGWPDGSTTTPGFISLGKILMEYVGSPLAACGKFDEVQMIFYRFNVHAGAARFFDSVASFLIRAPELELSLMKFSESPGVSIMNFINELNDSIISKSANPNYGISIVGDAETAAEANADTGAVDLPQISDALSKNLEVIYAEGGGEPVFTPPRISVYLECLPRVIPSDGTSPKKIEESQNVLRVHVYDARSTPSVSELFLLRAMNSSEIAARIGGSVSSPVTRPFRPFGTNIGILDKALKEEYIKQTGESDDGTVASFTGIRSSGDIKNVIKQTVPSITFGSGFSAIKSLNMSSTTSGDVQQVLLLNAIEPSPLADTSGNEKSSGIEDVIVIPASAGLTTFGCPLFTYGQHFFVDVGTGTTADNMYYVTGISHTLSPGQFDTKVDLTFADSGTVNSFRKKIESIITEP